MPATDVSSTQPSDLERLLAEPYWVIDLLPAQVPADSPGQFFGVERHLLASPWHRRLRRSFAEVLLKLNCYHDLVVYRGERPRGRANPSPRKLERWVRANRETLAIHLTSADALVTIDTDATNMTLYHPSPALLELVRAVAAASGLFVWQP
jgi:hypothetical protein